jgi:hypothetical protein
MPLRAVSTCQGAVLRFLQLKLQGPVCGALLCNVAEQLL